MMSLVKRSFLMRARRLGSRMYRRQMAEMLQVDRESFNEVQLRLLKRMYSDAVANVPYYHRNSDYPPGLLRDESDIRAALSQLPVLEKSTVKEGVASFLRVPASSPIVLKHTTGGTTGSPLQIVQSLSTRSRTTAVADSCYEHFCNLRNPRTLNLTGFLGSGTVWQRVPLSRSAFLSIYALNSENRSEIGRYLEDFRPQMFYGYASALVQLARLFPDGLPYTVSDNAIRFISTSETLAAGDQDLIETSLAGKVHNQYGSQEGQHFVFECDERGLHIHPARGIVELLKYESDDPVAPGEAGRVVVTGLQNPDMPLMRYSLGDTASRPLSDDVCACGCEWPMIGEVRGRTEDLVRTPDGRRIGLLSHATLKDVAGVVESQVRQRGFDSFIYIMRVDHQYQSSQAEAHIHSQLSSRLGYPVDIVFDYVDSIEKTAAGKLRAVVVDF